ALRSGSRVGAIPTALSAQQRVRPGEFGPAMALQPLAFVATPSVRLTLDRAGRHADDDGARCHVARDDGAGADHRPPTAAQPAQVRRVRPERRPPTDPGRLQFPIAAPQQFPAGRGRPRQPVVDKHHAVSDKDLVLDRDPLADEGMRRYLAARPDHGPRLHLDKGADQGLVPDGAAIEVDELRLRDPHPLTEPDVVADRHLRSPTTFARHVHPTGFLAEVRIRPRAAWRAAATARVSRAMPNRAGPAAGAG